MKHIFAIILTLFFSSISSHAQERLQKALEISDYGTAVHVIDSLMAIENADSVGLALQKARCLKKLYRADEAAGVLAAVLHLNPYDISLLAELAECHSQSGNTEDAFELYSTLSGMQPDNVYFKICMARILYHEKAYNECIPFCKEIIATDTIPDIITITADSYRHIGQADSALVYYDRFLTIKPLHARTVSKKADVLLAGKRYDEVLDMTDKFLRKMPDDMTVLPIHGTVLHMKKRYGESLEIFEKQRNLGDESFGILYYLGLNHLMLGHIMEAHQEFEKAYMIDSTDISLLYNLAETKSRIYNGTTPETERLYEMALELLEPDPMMMHNIYGSRAMSFHKAEDFRTAIEYYELSYRYNPKNISAISSIGYCYERLKDYRKAIEYYDTYLQLGKPGSAGYKFVTESLAHVEQELFMEQTE